MHGNHMEYHGGKTNNGKAFEKMSWARIELMQYLNEARLLSEAHRFTKRTWQGESTMTNHFAMWAPTGPVHEQHSKNTCNARATHYNGSNTIFWINFYHLHTSSSWTVHGQEQMSQIQRISTSTCSSLITHH